MERVENTAAEVEPVPAEAVTSSRAQRQCYNPFRVLALQRVAALSAAGITTKQALLKRRDAAGRAEIAAQTKTSEKP